MKPADIRYIVVHCSATRRQLDVGADWIDHEHKLRGWNGIGYHFVIRRDGTVETGRPLDQVGAHVYGYNRVSWGLCLIGGLDNAGLAENNFTSAQFASLRALLAGLHGVAPQAQVLGHRDLSPDVDGDGVIEPREWLKQCPCFNVREWYGHQAAA